MMFNIIIWIFFILVMSLAVLGKIIDTFSYLLYLIVMLYVIDIYYQLTNNKSF